MQELTEQQVTSEIETPAEETKQDSTLYPMDMNPINVRMNIVPSMEKPFFVTHELRKPSFKEEEARERAMPLETKDIGKIEGFDAQKTYIDDEPANVEFYDKLILSVSGYALEDGKIADKISPDTMVSTPDGEAAIRDLIPSEHKNTAINGMFPSYYEVVTEENNFVFKLGGTREWKIKQEIGGRMRQSDGGLSDPNYTITYTMREPTEIERRVFRKDAISGATLRDTKTNAIVERRNTNLKTVRDLFDALIVDIDGATIGGREIDARDKASIEQVPVTFKKGVIIKLFTFLNAELQD